EAAKTIEPDEDYIVPLGKARIVRDAQASNNQSSCLIVTYGMGVHWALQAEKQFPGRVEILDLRTLNPLDTELIYNRVKLHHRVLVLTEEQLQHSFAQALAGNISEHCFSMLDAPVM